MLPEQHKALHEAFAICLDGEIINVHYTISNNTQVINSFYGSPVHQYNGPPTYRIGVEVLSSFNQILRGMGFNQHVNMLRGLSPHFTPIEIYRNLEPNGVTFRTHAIYVTDNIDEFVEEAKRISRKVSDELFYREVDEVLKDECNT